MKRTLGVICAMVLGMVVTPVSAEPSWPSKPITLVNPYPPGAVSDLLARQVARVLKNELGQPVVVENKSGAGSNVGSEYVARSAADGYTLLNGSSANTANMSLYPSMPYDTLRDFAAVSLIAEVPTVLVVNTDLPVKNVQELLALAKKKPNELAYASAGAGSPAHLAAAHFTRMAGIQMRHIPYRGASPAVVDVMAGHVPVTLTNYAAVMAGIKSGKLRLLAVGTAKRWDLLPDVPTIAESGVPGYEASAWYGILAPKGTPAPVLAKLEKALQGLNTPESKEAIRQLGAEPVISSAETLNIRMKNEIDFFGKLIKESNISTD